VLEVDFGVQEAKKARYVHAVERLNARHELIDVSPATSPAQYLAQVCVGSSFEGEDFGES
jgi:hypothetical protein